MWTLLTGKPHNHACKEEGCAVTTQETAALREWEDGTLGTFIGSLDR
jgi:hypothetical protein